MRRKFVLVAACLAAFNVSTAAQRSPRDATHDAGPTYTTIIKGQVTSCGEFKREFGPDLVFVLRGQRDAFHDCIGWRIAVTLVDDDINLAEVNDANVLQLFASMFAPGHQPALSRMFDFSPEVKRVHTLVEQDGDARRRLGELLQRMKPFGTGAFGVLSYSLAAANPDNPQGALLADTMRFEVTLWLPNGYPGFPTR